MTAEQLLHQARQAYQQGQKQSAASYLKQAVQLYPHDYRVWLMLAQVAPNQQAREECIAQAAKLAPHEPLVQKAQKWVKQHTQPVASPRPEPTPPPTVEPFSELRQQLQNRPTPKEPNPSPASKKWVWITILIIGLLLIVFTGLWQFRPVAEDLTAGVNQTEELAQISNSPTPELPTVTPTNTPLPPTVTPQPTEHPIRAKPIGQTEGDLDPRSTWTATPSPSPTPSPTPTPRPTFVADEYVSRPALIGSDEKWIDVNLTTQRLVAYEGDEAVFATDISSGLYPNLTVTGQFRIYLRFEKQTMDGRRLGFDYVTENVPYVQYFYGDFALHGAFWHDDFGTPVSHGCVNLTVDDSLWLYNWATYGTLVNVHY